MEYMNANDLIKAIDNYNNNYNDFETNKIDLLYSNSIVNYEEE